MEKRFLALGFWERAVGFLSFLHGVVRAHPLFSPLEIPEGPHRRKTPQKEDSGWLARQELLWVRYKL